MPYALLPTLPNTCSPAQILAGEQHWLRDCARDGQPRAHLWQAPRCLIVTRKDTRLPRYAAACKQLAAEGWPVHVRDSGGTAVPHGAGILNLSLLLPRTTTDLAHYYRLLGAPGQDHQGAVLAQAMLLVAGDVDEGTRMASRFYELAGGELRFVPGTSTTLASCIDWRGSDQALVEKVRARLDSLLSEGLSSSS